MLNLICHYDILLSSACQIYFTFLAYQVSFRLKVHPLHQFFRLFISI